MIRFIDKKNFFKKKSADCAIKQGMNRLTINTEIFKDLESLIAVFEKRKGISIRNQNTQRTDSIPQGQVVWQAVRKNT